MSNDVNAAIERIKSRTGVTDPEMIELVSRVTTRYATLSARALSGEDVAAELAQAEAQALNLSSGERRIIGEELGNFFQATLQGVLTKLLIG